MPNENGTQTMEPDEKPTINLADDKAGSPSKERTDKPSTSRRKKVLVISAVVVVAIVAAYFAWNAFRYEDTDDAQIDGHIMPLSARINGQVLKVNFVEGQLVHEGDVLVIIDPEDYKIAVIQAQAALEDARASATSSHWYVPITSVTTQSNLDSAQTAVLNAEAGLRAAEQNHESAKAALTQAEANAVKSDADLERAKQLVAKEDISRQQYDQAVATATANRAAVTSAAAALLAAVLHGVLILFWAGCDRWLCLPSSGSRMDKTIQRRFRSLNTQGRVSEFSELHIAQQALASLLALVLFAGYPQSIIAQDQADHLFW